MRSFRLRSASTLVAIVAAAACGDSSTGPRQQTAAQIATHFDSIALAATAQAQTNELYGSRAFLATLLELPAALGALPSTISVTTASGTEQWKSYELLEVPASGSGSDSSFIFLAFRDSDAHTAIVVDFDGTGHGPMGGIITGDTIFVNPSDASGSTSLTSIGSTCATPSSSLLNPQLDSLSIASCNLASFKTSLSLTSSSTAEVDAALTSVSFTNATISGVRAVDQTAGATVRRIRAILHAAAANKRH
ncbi:MAG: hypothetical protein ABI889_04720 [Gemmatimonadota bacterium]